MASLLAPRGAQVRKIVDTPPLYTDPSHAWVRELFEMCTPLLDARPTPKTITFSTDGADLKRGFGGPPAVILGPGETRDIDTFCVEAGRWEAGETSHRRQARRAPLNVWSELANGLSGERGPVTGRVEIERVSAQHRTAPEETSTPGYTMVNASLDWHPFAENPDLTLSLTGNNLFDVDARRHASDLKDYAPLAGRDIRLSARIGF